MPEEEESVETLCHLLCVGERGGSDCLTLSVVLSHARHFRECEQYITHSATSMSLFSLSLSPSSFSIGKTKNETDSPSER